eukprot:COSAG01_NODE_19342_length_1016_cov_0.791712_2_plen_153_part_00
MRAAQTGALIDWRGPAPPTKDDVADDASAGGGDGDGDDDAQTSCYERTVDSGVEPLPGFDLALKKMKAGARAELQIRPDYQPVVDWSKALAPRHRIAVSVVVRLLSFESEKESWELKKAEKLEFAERIKAMGNQCFKDGALCQHTSLPSCLH